MAAIPAGNEGAPVHGYTFAGERGPMEGQEQGEQRFTLSAFVSRDGSKGSVAPGIERFKKSKPWDRRRSALANTKIRVKLPTIESYDKEVVCAPNAAPKVMVRLERVTGTDRVRIKNVKYLSMLSKRISEEEEKLVGQIHKRRKDEELIRYRDLVIKGEIEAHEGMEDLTRHPLYRVNRIMKRLNSMQFSPNDTLNPRLTSPKITPIEPFSIYEKTGILFGHHEGHYLKHKAGQTPATDRSTSGISSTESAVVGTGVAPEVGLEETPEFEEEWDGEGEEPTIMEEQPQRSSQTALTFTPEAAVDLGHLLRRSSMSLARRYLGLAPQDEFKLQRSRIVKEFLNSDDPAGQPMYDLATGITGAMQRTQAKGDEFCTKTHRKLFL